MTKRERRTYFERLCAMREAYLRRDAGDQASSTTMLEAMAAAQQLFEQLIAEDAEGQPAADATSTNLPA
jgi:hypothetical protein